MPKKKIVIFADGTGNAFTSQESNVWRLYEALDTSAPDQIAYYIKGVGTSAVGVVSALDRATGVGVPSNVRKLYRFLCWNWNPGDEDVWRTLALRRLLVADFVAPEAGNLFLYVNDAVQIFPFWGSYDKFYKNNSGRARVLVQRSPLPPPPD